MSTDLVETNGTGTVLAAVPASHEMTPAQAKIDAVAQLTMKVYERASMLQLTEDESKRLQADFPDDAFRPGAGGKNDLIYIEHASLRERLNEVFGPGQWTLIPRSRWTEEFRTAQNKSGIRIYVEAMLCIRGCYVDEAIGDMDYYPHNAQTNYGDAVEGAKTQALRRCAKTLGIGLQAWKKGWCEEWWKRRNNPKPQQAAQQPAQQTKPADAVDQSILAMWKRDLQPGFPVDELNAMLPDMKKITSLETRKAVWKMVQDFAVASGFIWDADEKKFAFTPGDANEDEPNDKPDDGLSIEI